MALTKRRFVALQSIKSGTKFVCVKLSLRVLYIVHPQDLLDDCTIVQYVSSTAEATITTDDCGAVTRACSDANVSRCRIKFPSPLYTRCRKRLPALPVLWLASDLGTPKGLLCSALALVSLIESPHYCQSIVPGCQRPSKVSTGRLVQIPEWARVSGFTRGRLIGTQRMMPQKDECPS